MSILPRHLRREMKTLVLLAVAAGILLTAFHAFADDDLPPAYHHRYREFAGKDYDLTDFFIWELRFAAVVKKIEAGRGSQDELDQLKKDIPQEDLVQISGVVAYRTKKNGIFLSASKNGRMVRLINYPEEDSVVGGDKIDVFAWKDNDYVADTNSDIISSMHSYDFGKLLPKERAEVLIQARKARIAAKNAEKQRLEAKAKAAQDQAAAAAKAAEDKRKADMAERVRKFREQQAAKAAAEASAITNADTATK